MPVYLAPKNEWTKDGRRYFFLCYKKNLYGENEKHKSKKYRYKNEAEDAERLFLVEEKNPMDQSFYLIAQKYFINLATIRKEATVSTYFQDYTKHIRPVFDHLKIGKINVLTINKWKDSLLKEEYKINYLNKLYNILNQIFTYAMSNLYITSNPVEISGRFQIKKDEVVKDEEKIRYITFDQFQQFIFVIDDLMWKTFFTFLYYTGMRKGEVLALTWEDIDFEQNLIIVNKTLYSKIKGKYTITSTKNNLNRKIKMSKTLVNQLLIYKTEMIKYSDFTNQWFVFGCGRFLPPTNIDRYKNHYFKLSGLKPITIHEFRHSHVSLLINEYIKSGQTDTSKFFLMMSERMGHTIQVMQRTYMHLLPTSQDEIVNLLDNL